MSAHTSLNATTIATGAVPAHLQTGRDATPEADHLHAAPTPGTPTHLPSHLLSHPRAHLTGHLPAYGRDQFGDVVEALRTMVAHRLGEGSQCSRLPPQGAADEVAAAVQQALDEHARLAVQMGVAPLPVEVEDHVRRQLAAAFSGLGGLQELLDDPQSETININGCDRVFVQRRDGTRIRMGPVAASDQELMELLRALGSGMSSELRAGADTAGALARGAGLVGGHERRFDHGSPQLSLALPGGARLQAVMDVSDRVSVSIRCHPAGRIDLADLVRAGEMDEGLAQFLSAMVRARRNIVVSGGPSTGKTTLLRGLASQIPPAERLIVVEDVSELRLPEVDHPDMVTFQVREANLEGAGEIDARQLVRTSLRMSPDRVIVGEVRGPEVEQMAKAMSIGIDGSMATVHASSSGQALSRLVSYAMEPGAGYTFPAATSLIAGAVHAVVHLERLPEGRRVIASVREVLDDATGAGAETGSGAAIASNEIYRPGPDGRAVPATPPRCLDLLTRHGFDPAWLQTDRRW